jgi:hypothetical protein
MLGGVSWFGVALKVGFLLWAQAERKAKSPQIWSLRAFFCV